MPGHPHHGAVDHEVVIVGAGPTGLMLAGELALAGVDVALIDRRTDQHVDSSRAGGLHARTLEVLDQRGIVDRFIDAGTPMQVQGYAYIPLDISDFPTRFNHGLALPQKDFEPILAGWVLDDLGVTIRRGDEVEAVTQDGAHVTVRTSGARSVRGQYVVGCDGGRSVVRRQAGIGFVGTDASTSWILAEVDLGHPPPLGMRHDDLGSHGVGPLGEGGPFRIALTEAELHTEEPTLQDLDVALRTVFGTDCQPRNPSWISRFTDQTRQAVTYRSGRVLLAGDAAHIHPPHGGQGLNVGLQDAVNLGWKLAQVVRGVAPDSLLDSYHDERHPVGAVVVASTSAQVALARPDARSKALHATVTDLLAMDEPRRRVAAMMAGLDIVYDLGGDHPLVGRRMPDLDLQTPTGPTRTFALLHAARPVLIDLTGGTGLDLGPWSDRVTHVQASTEGPWDLPVVGPVTAPRAVLIRPDGHVSWVGHAGDATAVGLTDALTRWFGAPPAHR